MPRRNLPKWVVMLVTVPVLAALLLATGCQPAAPSPTAVPPKPTAATGAPAAATAPAAAATAPAAAKPQGQPLKIGGSLPLTGGFAENAKWIKEGYEFWRDDVNQRGGLLGRPVELVIYDDAGTPDKAVSFYEKAITVDKVELIFGAYPGTSGAAIMPLADKYKMVMSGMGGHRAAFSQGLKYTFASPPLLGEWAGAIAPLAASLIPADQRPKTVAMMSMNTAIGDANRVGLQEGIDKVGMKIVMDEKYALPLADATPLISKAKQSGAEALFLNGTFDDSVLAMRAAKSQKYNPKLIAQNVGGQSPGWVKELGPDADYVINSMNWYPTLPFAKNKEITAAAKSRLNLDEPPVYFGLGYSWMYLLELGVKGANTLDQAKVQDYISKNKFDLPFGNGITFTNGLPPQFVFVVQTLKGKLELVYPAENATAKFVYPRPDNWK